MAEDFPKAGRRHRHTDSRSLMNPTKNNLKKSTPRHSIVKLPKNKDKGEKVLKATREK